jgi:phosphoglycolate phosphatase
MIILDLDGTLIDSRVRLHKLFIDLVGDYQFSLQEYWDLKRGGSTHETILIERYEYGEQQVKVFKEQWLQRVETPTYLQLDVSQDESTGFIENLVQISDCILLTARMNEELVFRQLEQLGWISFFSDVIVAGVGRTKLEAASHLSLCRKDWLIGDTCEDITTARKLGCSSASVSNGFVQHQRLEGCCPDFIATNLNQLLPVLTQR